MNLRGSLTRDRGKELADHKRLTLATDLEVCFCDPHSPRQRGTNANTNQLLRQYFPKGTDLSMHGRTQPDAMVQELNERRRKTLNQHSPDEKFAECGDDPLNGQVLPDVYMMSRARTRRAG